MKKLLEKNKLRRIVSVLLFTSAVIFSGVILVREGTKIPWQDFHLNIGLVILSLVVSTIGYIPAFVSWQNILHVYRIQSLTMDDFRNFVYAMLGSMLPGGVWQLVGRSMLYSKQEGGSVKIAAASGLEIIIIGAGAWLVYLVGLYFYPEMNFIQLGPLFQILFLVPIVIVLEPHVLERLNSFVLKKVQPKLQVQAIRFSLMNIIFILAMEVLTVLIGGLAVFIFLNSVVEIPIQNIIPIIAAYSFSIAFANLLFWFPGKMIVKDSALAIALTQFTPLGMSLVFVILVRLWSIFTILVPAGLVWLIFDVFHLFKRETSVT